MSSIIKYILLGLIFITSISAHSQKRCAIDIGSGSIKVQMALFDCDKNKIIELLDAPFYVDVPLANYYAQDGDLNESIQAVAVDAFDTILKKCAQNDIVKLAGIATEIFRKAQNGPVLFSKLKELAEKHFGNSNVNLQIVSQELEGKLGFLTASALSSEIELSRIVAWDSGNASFQLALTNNDILETFDGKMGTAIAAKLFIESIRNNTYQKGIAINPVSSEELKQYIDSLSSTFSISAEFIKKIHVQNKKLIGLGCPRSIFSMGSKTIGKNNYSKEEVYKVINVLAKLEQADQKIIKLDPVEPETVLIRLILMYVVMTKLGIETVSYKASTGNALGILLSPDFWNN